MMNQMTMEMNRNGRLVKKILAALLMLLTMAGVFAGFKEEAHAVSGIDWGKAVYISRVGQVVDKITVNGKTVNSIYKPNYNTYNYDRDSTYCCAAFVKRFYKTVYGVDVWNLNPGNVPCVSSGSFTRTNSPRVGDIAANPTHWAIVKGVSASGVSVIEQNCWNTKRTSAMVGRKLGSKSGYWYFRWTGNKAKPAKISFTYNIQGTKTSQTNAVIATYFNNPSRVRVTKVGCRIYNKSGKLLKTKTEACSRPESRFKVWYDINKELGMKLARKTTYKYNIFIIHNGVTYSTKTYSFTTK